MLNSEQLAKFKEQFSTFTKSISSEILSWITILILHAATIPMLLAVMTGVTDTMPPIDITLMMWTALMLLFIKAAIKRHMLYLVTIGTGFFLQATILALIFFK
jgi:hypothetical protein